MAKLTFDAAGEKEYQYGVEKTVLYLRDGTSAVWNGVTSIEENAGMQSLKSYYLDGKPFLNAVSPGAFEGTLNAYTYPEEFLVVEGTFDVGTYVGHPGMYITHQRPETFSLSYQTRVGSDLDADAGYKIHMLYGLLAAPSDKVFQTLGATISPGEFSWDLKSIPESYGGVWPTSHVIFDSRKVNWWWLDFLENWLYGTDDQDPYFPSYAELVYNYVGVNGAGPNTPPVTVVDNGDGTWTATDSNGQITMVNASEFSITEVDGSYIDADTYVLEVNG